MESFIGYVKGYLISVVYTQAYEDGITADDSKRVANMLMNLFNKLPDVSTGVSTEENKKSTDNAEVQLSISYKDLDFVIDVKSSDNNRI